MKYLEEANSQRQRGDYGLPGLGGEVMRMPSWCFECQLGKMKRLWRWVVGMAAQHCERS